MSARRRISQKSPTSDLAEEPDLPAPRRARSLSLSLAILVLVSSSACGRSEARSTDLRLKDALDRLRDDRSGDPMQRETRLAAVKQIHPETSAGDAAWTACVTAYTDLSIAEESITRAETEMRTAKATGVGVSPLVLKEVADAEIRLEKARSEMPACDEAAAKLALAVR